MLGLSFVGFKSHRHNADHSGVSTGRTCSSTFGAGLFIGQLNPENGCDAGNDAGVVLEVTFEKGNGAGSHTRMGGQVRLTPLTGESKEADLPTKS